MSSTIIFEDLIKEFEVKRSLSKDPDTFLRREINYIETLLDSGKPPVPFSRGDISAVRAAYNTHIVSGLPPFERYAPALPNDEVALWATGPSKPTEDPYEFDLSKARKFKLVPPPDKDVDAFNIASALFKYLQWLRSLKQADITELIARRGCLELIYGKYKEYFKSETQDSWMLRFINNEAPLPSIDIEPLAKDGSDRLILIAILHSIQDTLGNAFDFAKYVKTRFGIKGLESSKSRNKHKRTYIETYNYCKSVLNK